MSRYLQLNDAEEPAELSSNSGWSQFIEWVNSLDASEYPALAEFSEKGTTTNLQLVADQIEDAAQITPPPEDVSSICETLREYLDGEEGIATVT